MVWFGFVCLELILQVENVYVLIDGSSSLKLFYFPFFFGLLNLSGTERSLLKFLSDMLVSFSNSTNICFINVEGFFY